MTHTTCRRVLVGAVLTVLVLTAARDSLAQNYGGSRTRNRSVSRPRANRYLDYFRSGYGDYRRYMRLEDAVLAPYLRRGRNTASRLPGRDRAGGPSAPALDPTVERARAARAARAGMPGTAPAAGKAAVAPTGIGSVYMQYSHYYQAGAAGRRRR
jgi:hypothetical protein